MEPATSLSTTRVADERGGRKPAHKDTGQPEGCPAPSAMEERPATKKRPSWRWRALWISGFYARPRGSPWPGQYDPESEGGSRFGGLKGVSFRYPLIFTIPPVPKPGIRSFSNLRDGRRLIARAMRCVEKIPLPQATTMIPCVRAGLCPAMVLAQRAILISHAHQPAR
jgi:hypothetical protein